MKRWTVLFLALSMAACNVADTDERPQLGANNDADAGANSGTEDASNSGDSGDTNDAEVVEDALEVVSVNPMNGATDVGLESQLVLVFSETIDLNTLTESDVTVASEGSEVTFELDVGDDTATIDFTPLQPTTNYEVTLAETVAGLDSGATLSEPFTTTFATSGFEVLSVTPADGASDVPVTASILITMSDEVMQESVVPDAVTVKADPPLPNGETNVPITVSVDGSRLEITPESSHWREYEVNYEVTLATIESVEGVPSEPFSTSFSTALFARGETYNLRCGGRLGREVLEAESPDNVQFDLSLGSEQVEWGFVKDREAWAIFNLLHPDVFVESNDGSDPISLTDPVGDGNFFAGQAWSFEAAPGIPIERFNFPGLSAASSPYVYFMQTEFAGPSMALACESRRPRMEDRRDGDDTLLWHFTRISR